MDNKYYALRPIEHVDGRRVHSHGGTILVQLVRSTSGRRSRLQPTVATLGLSRIDDACVISESDPRYDSMVAAQHVLSVERLDVHVPPGDFRLYVGPGGSVMYREDYGSKDMPPRPAEIVVVGDGEYLQVETSSSTFSALWSSDDGPLECFASAVSVLGTPSSESGSPAFLQLDTTRGDGESGAGDLDDVLQYVKEVEPPVAFLRVTFDQCEVVWSSKQQRLTTSTAEFAEVSVRVFDSARRRSILDALIAETGSSELRHQRLDVESKIDQISAA